DVEINNHVIQEPGTHIIEGVSVGGMGLSGLADALEQFLVRSAGRAIVVPGILRVVSQGDMSRHGIGVIEQPTYSIKHNTIVDVVPVALSHHARHVARSESRATGSTIAATFEADGELFGRDVELDGG